MAWWDRPTSSPAAPDLHVLQHGGNAVDAAVAVGFALAVTHPAAGNLGGGGFMVIRMADGRETTIDYREMAPAAAVRDMFLDTSGEPVPERSLVGPLASGVPGSVAGMALAQRRYGRLPLAVVIGTGHRAGSRWLRSELGPCRLAPKRAEPVGKVSVLGTGLPAR